MLETGRHQTIHGLEHLDKVINIDQKAIGRTPRSNPATYTKVFDFIRDFFAQLPESNMRGYKKGRYSFNVKGGRCEGCRGDGYIKVEMHFLADVYVPCETCRGKRFNDATLEIKIQGPFHRRCAGPVGHPGAGSFSKPSAHQVVSWTP
jgi:excinuclease ABC subunit A